MLKQVAHTVTTVLHACLQTDIGIRTTKTNTEGKKKVRSLLVTTSMQLISQPHTINALRINITVGSRHTNAVPSIVS